MHIQLTDILTCPVCGPAHGLILRADMLRERRVWEGALGCPNCERNWPVREGIALLDPVADGIPGDTGASGSAADPEAALRIAALLGLNDARGFALVAGPDAALADDVAGLAPAVEIIADARRAPAGRTSRMIFGTKLPFYDARLHGIWLSGKAADALLEEAARTLHPLGRLVLEGAPADAGERLAAAGLRIAAREDRTVLAVRA